MGSTLQDLYKYKTNETPPNHLQSGMLKEIASSSSNAHLCFLIFKYLSANILQEWINFYKSQSFRFLGMVRHSILQEYSSQFSLKLINGVFGMEELKAS